MSSDPAHVVFVGEALTKAEKLKTVHDWVKAFEELWGHQLDRIKERAEQRAREHTESPTRLKPRKGHL
jgi:hypothetical protein